jgi:hypothetical protein
MACKHFTPEELRKAWQARRRHTWPATFEEAIKDPCIYHQIRIEARISANRELAQRHRQALPVMPTTPTRLDFKRRAAGERDDD